MHSPPSSQPSCSTRNWPRSAKSKSLQKAIMTLEEFFHRSEFAYSAWEKSIKVPGQSKWRVSTQDTLSAMEPQRLIADP